MKDQMRNNDLNALQIKACIITSETPAVLTKTRALDIATGSIITENNSNLPMGSVIKGTAENVTFKSLQEFATFLDTAGHNKALIAGQHTADTTTVQIMSTGYYEKNGKPAGAITRTKNNFTRPQNQQGLLILDCDDKQISKEQFMTAIKQVIPNLDDTAYIYTTSSSSYLYDADKLIQGDKGKRLYIVLEDCSDALRAGQALFDRLWINGHGYYEIGSAGQLLNRGIIDTAMFKDTCRLDFISGSNCKAPLRQARPPAEINEGRPLNSITALANLDATEKARLDAMQISYKGNLTDKAQAVKKQYCIKRAGEHLLKQGITDPTDKQRAEAEANVLKALDTETLTGDFIITLAKSGEQVTIAEVLADCERYDGAETLDPLEPHYNNYSATGKLFLKDKNPNLHSFAHGGKNYKLFKQDRFIKHTRGRTADTTTATIRLMQVLPNFFDMGKQLVTVKGGQVIPMTEHLLTYELGMTVQFYTDRESKDGDTKPNYIDPPKEVIRQILSMQTATYGGNTQRGLKPLKAVITAPTITEDNHVIYKRGYDAKTQLYLSVTEDLNPPAGKPTTADLKDAYRAIMNVIDTFKLNTALDRSVVLSAFLTAVVRPTLDKAPIFCFDAPTQGSGKTYLAECIGIVATGSAPSITPAIQGNEAEIQKTLLAMLMNGASTIIWDNIMGAFNSATMASFTTAINYSGRVLGASEQITLPNKAMVIFTGNNLKLYGDLPRRCITARIDTGEENPLNTKRDLRPLKGLKPDQYLLDNRNEIVMSAITIIRAFLMSDTCRTSGRYTEHAVASFEQWDAMARQPILHLSAEGIAPEMTDVKQSIDANMTNDIEKERLEMLIGHLHSQFMTAPFTARDVMNFAFDFTGQPATGAGAELAELLSDMTAKGKKPNSITTGHIITYRLDRIADGKKIVALPQKGKHAKQYRIVEL